MPRFFFRVHDGVNLPDRGATEFADWREAQFEAIRRAGASVAGTAERMKLGEDWSLEVTNEGGQVLFCLDFSV